MTSVFNSPLQPEEIRRLPLLTSREWDVLLLLTEYASPEEIADTACITRKSFHNYKGRISRKLGLSGSKELQSFVTARRDQIQGLFEIFSPNRKIRLGTEELTKIEGSGSFGKKYSDVQFFSTSIFEEAKICNF